ncbi:MULTISPECIES: type III secretion system chaperone [Candidatus Ichthyocystis]|uniref:Putative Tir famliy protein n=1 Tax=Candidatus Ichthyocystis hellenicum TaxID=1561003 RepID=A0A0S4M6S2_9BURK|nr:MULTISPECIES: type III secretion system chaperone [Ichthyocystis]CUT17092.1 putative Tir famliy protein [Candidatus Ichthyocystis hellenicum]
MNTMVDAKSLVVELGSLLKLPGLKLNEQGVASLIADKKFSVNLEHSSVDGVIHIYSKVMDLDGPVSDVICRKLMALNAYGNETSGASFAWDELHHEIILWRRVDLQVANAHYLMGVLELFLDQVERWRSRLERGLESLEEPRAHEGQGSHSSGPHPAAAQINAIRG